MWWKRKRHDFQAEIDAHLQLEADELQSDGLDPAEARTAAQRALGNRTSIEERFHESSPWMSLDHTFRDLKYASRVVLREWLLVTAIGLASGLTLALALGRVLSGILYEAQAVDLLVLGLATLLLKVVSMLSCYLPARKAARIDPMVALRFD
jgi:hypothetical protein